MPFLHGMPFDLYELREQRERIRQHLAWLDVQIADAEARPSGPPESPPNPPSNLPAVPRGKPVSAEPGASTTPPSVANQSAPSAVRIPNAAETILPDNPPGFGTGSKFGCILASVALVGLFLFLLFGLPYLRPEQPFSKKDAQQIVLLEEQVSAIQNPTDRVATLQAITDTRAEAQAQLDALRDRGSGLGTKARRLENVVERLEELAREAQTAPLSDTNAP